MPNIARPISPALHARIQQRIHMSLDGFDPPSPEVSWWKPENDYAINKKP
jgi:hypothetical protein